MPVIIDDMEVDVAQPLARTATERLEQTKPPQDERKLLEKLQQREWQMARLLAD
jgi:hypothetical protein